MEGIKPVVLCPGQQHMDLFKICHHLIRIHTAAVGPRNAETRRTQSCAGKTLSHYATRFGESFRREKTLRLLRVLRVSALNRFSSTTWFRLISQPYPGTNTAGIPADHVLEQRNGR